ncbi:prepilin-type N-terminal cleavage/methylation domain-containing protein [Vibrio gallicus]|uniref:prepilin-type N-terminal cleavage/methylation domain-containing protein n=1 Tax=Vibrio gallicus TaxID=190897 RepID=UPI0021C4541E|nr:prepilin-type N-terminal cleavage/methylation domain-containing protein [Vibrio gallicus]
MKRNGFTLIELVVTIVVVAIIGLGITTFVEFGLKGYSQSVERQRLQGQARFVLEKMGREVQYAVPNSIHISAQGCLEFYPIQYAGFYTKQEPINAIEFVIANQNFDYSYTFAQHTRMVINPTRIADLEIDNAGNSVTGQSRSLQGVSSSTAGDYYSVTMRPPSDSAANRVYIYMDNNRVSYCLQDMGDGTSARLVRENKGATVTVATDLSLTESRFQFEDSALQRGGLVHLDLLFFNGDERSSYKHDIQVSNVP